MKHAIALLILTAVATSAPSARVAVPAGGYYDRPHYYHPHYRGY